METLRFLMVTTFYPPYHVGGDAVHVKYLAKALAEKGHEVHVEFVPAAYRLKRRGAPPPPSIGEDMIRLHPIPSPWGRMQPAAAYLLGRSRSITRFHNNLVEDIKPDVVHYHNISLLGMGVLRRPRSARTLYTAHDYWVRCPRSDLFKYGLYPCDTPTCVRCALVSRRPPQLWRYRRAWKGFRGVDCVIAPSKFMLRNVEQEFACPIVHIPNFTPDPNPEGRVWSPEGYYLYVGVHEPHKGIMEIASVADLRPRGLSFVFVGRGKCESLLRKLQRNGLTNIEVHGWVEPMQLAHLYRRARGLIIPSLWHENSPLVAIEAISWGTPLLVSRRGGLEELLRDGEAGLSFEPKPSEILSLIEHFEEEGLPQRLRAQARRAYEKCHRPSRYLDQYMVAIEEEEKESPQMVSQESLPRDGSNFAHTSMLWE